MTAWIEYLSTDAGAAVLDGTVGSMNNVLRQCLVTGNATAGKAAAGWSEPFAAAGNVANFRAGAGLLRPYMNVNDNAPRAAPFANACECRVKVSEAATALSTQTGLFPTAAQVPNGLIIRKSKNATASPWIVYADDRTMYMFIQSGDYGVAWHGLMVGEYFSLDSAPDAFNGLTIGRITEQIVGTPTALPSQEVLHTLTAVGAVTAGHYIARSFTELAQAAVNVGKHGAGEHSVADLVGLMEWPNPVDGGTHLDNVRVHELITPNFTKRGRLRGFYHLLHPAQTFNHLDTFQGTGSMVGKTFRVIKPTPNYLGVFIMEKSDTVEKNT
jgi:hypothetical protein